MIEFVRKIHVLRRVVPSTLAAFLSLLAGMSMLAVCGTLLWMASGVDILILGFVDGISVCFLLGLGVVTLLSSALTSIVRTWPYRGGGAMELITSFAWLGVLCFAFLTLFAIADRHYTPIDPTSGTAPHAVVVRERSFLLLMSGQVFERNGIVLTPRSAFTADDGHQPFHSGAYDAEWIGGRLYLRYSTDSKDSPRSTEMIVGFD